MYKVISLLMTVVAIGLAVYSQNTDRCHAVVLEDMRKHKAFQNEMAKYADKTDFLTEMTK